MTGHKEEVVISGVGGLFPECNNMDELKNLLFNKINGVTIDSRRWNINELGAINGTGKLKSIEKFDATFFSAHPKLAENMDPMTRLCLERSIEAIIDAGLSPSDLYGSNTAVFTGSALSAAEMCAMDCSQNSAFIMLGASKTMQSNRVSYILNLSGPSFTMDGGWICGSNGLKKAKEMIEDGIITSAIVGVTNLVIRPEIQFQFQGINRLNQNDQTKSFSNNADGYNRSEACVFMFLQRACEAKRSYGTLLKVNSMQFGDHQGHIAEHIGDHYKSLLLDTYREANIDPATVEFIEAYGSGIKNNDSMELNVLEEVFCTKQRKIPLKVGSVKSNIGHCDASSLFVSIVKAIIALDGGYIPPNINYIEPNESIAALKTGKIQIVTEKTPLIGDIIGVSSFGILNAFSHVILKRNKKIKLHNTDHDDYIPRLIVASGRNEYNARESVMKIKSYGNDAEYIALTNGVFTKSINAHFYRCFSIYPNLDESRIDNVWNVNFKKRPVWFIFSGMGSQWQGMGSQLMKLDVFADAINKCDSILKPRGVDIINVLTSQDPKLFDNILNSFVGIAAVQIGLVEVLKALDITPDGIIGHSVGELGCAYADGCFTAEEMILSAYARGRVSLESEFIPGMMAAIGLGYHQIKDRIPYDIDIACHNSDTSCTISGPVDSIKAFVSKLTAEGVFAKAVNVAGIAFHSRYIQMAGPTLLKYLKDVIKEPKLRSSKWVSSSLPETKWNSDLAKYSSPEYHTNNLLSSVLFEDALKHIPSDAIVIEIAPHGLLQAILKSALPETVTNIPLTKKIFGDSIRFLLTAIGNMYTCGMNPKIQKLYPPIEFPVSRGTPSIHILPLWDHNDQWTPAISRSSLIHGFPGEKTTSILLNESTHLIEYRIHGHHILPLSYVLINVWKMFVEINSKTFAEEPVQFINLRFKNNVKIHTTNSSESYIMIQWGSGLFEYTFDEELIFSGKICYIHDTDTNAISDESIVLDKNINDFQGSVSNDEVYAMLENNGYSLGKNYKNINNFDMYKNNILGYVKWENDWIYFLDGILKFPLLDNLSTCRIEAPVSVRQINIDPKILENIPKKDICVNYNMVTNEITCDGVKISDVKYGPLTLPKLKSSVVTLERQTFIQFNDSKCKDINEFICDSMDIIMEIDKLNFNTTIAEKLIICNPYHYEDPVSIECIKLIKQIVESQLSINSITLNWDNIQNVSEYDISGRFITVTNDKYLQNTMKSLVSKKCSYIVVYTKQKQQNFKNWNIITQQKFNNNSFLTLIKKEIVLDENSLFIKSNNDDFNMTIWAALEKYNSTSEAMIYIISKSEPLGGVNTYVKKILQKYKSQKLRFIFILDPNAPEFESNKSFYMAQLSKGLIINIYKNSGWGSYKRIVLQNIKDNIKVIENPVLKIFSANSTNKLTVRYLGLNFKDIVVENNTEFEFGPLEYSGYVRGNKTVMGITTFKQMPVQMKYDELLSWSIPSSWTVEDATTVPLTYAMGYYIFNVLCTLQSDKSILVTSGLHPIGQAAISIGLAEKCETYAIVESNQQADQLSSIFPELVRSRILINTNNKFDISLKMMTKSKGIDFILNFLSGDAFYAAFRALAYHGKFFNFSKSDMKNHKNFGTRIFLQNTAFYVVSSNMLLNENDQNKHIVQQAFADGLNNGVIKPFHKCVLTMPFSTDKMFNAMRTASIMSYKVILSLTDITCEPKDNFEHDSYQYYPDHVYVVVGNPSDWLDIAEWLVDRGAQRVVIAVKRCFMSPINCRRFNRLLSRNISIQIESDLCLKTKEESVYWLNRLTSCNILGSIFMINQFDDKKINNMGYAFEEYPNKTKMTSFVCISSKGEHICAGLKSVGLNAINISWDGLSTRPKKTEQLLISLDTLLRETNTTETSSFICTEPGANKSEWSQQMNDVIANFFPQSTDELHLLNNKITKEAEFVEVQTKSPRFAQTKSVMPIFVIPGFKPKLIETLYTKLYYPTFEAQMPEVIGSIDELSNNLVIKLKSITDHGYVSLIGESWGGIVALKMAQLLEAQGTLVAVSLLEGDPEFLTGWAESFLSNDNFINKLNTMYSSFNNQITKQESYNCNENIKLSNTSSRSEILDNKTERILNTIRSRLRALLESKPLPNKLFTKVLVFRYERTFEFYRANLNDYCVNSPFVYVISKTDYKSMVTDKETVDTLTNNAVLLYPAGIELSLSDKYKHFYFNIEKNLKSLN